MEWLDFIVPLFILIPLGWKWKLPFLFLLCLWILSVPINLFFTDIFGLNDSLCGMILLPGIIPSVLFFGCCLVRFYYDPNRRLPDQADAILCPADGIIRYIHHIGPDGFVTIQKKGRKIALDQITKSVKEITSCVHMGIEMRIVDVHVNRAPISGSIVSQEKIPGQFRSLRDFRSLLENERVVTLIDNNQFQVILVQIASRLVRRIVSFHDAGTWILQGHRIGKIQFGSQVDVIIPDLSGLKIEVAEGQKVRAGETIIARFNLSDNKGQ